MDMRDGRRKREIKGSMLADQGLRVKGWLSLTDDDDARVAAPSLELGDIRS
ncbi:hypothetical protein Trydic_g5033, partial [Trypoxylus dichotomus]